MMPSILRIKDLEGRFSVPNLSEYLLFSVDCVLHTRINLKTYTSSHWKNLNNVAINKNRDFFSTNFILTKSCLHEICFFKVISCLVFLHVD